MPSGETNHGVIVDWKHPKTVSTEFIWDNRVRWNTLKLGRKTEVVVGSAVNEVRAAVRVIQARAAALSGIAPTALG